MEAISCHSHPESAFILPGILPVFGKIPALIPEINQGWCSDDLAKVWSNSLSICDLASSCYNLKHIVCISLGWLKQSNNSPVVVIQIVMHQRNWWISLLWCTICFDWSWNIDPDPNHPKGMHLTWTLRYWSWQTTMSANLWPKACCGHQKQQQQNDTKQKLLLLGFWCWWSSDKQHI